MSRSVRDVKPSSFELVDAWVADLFGIPEKLVWQQGVTVGMHAGFDDHPGIVVFSRGESVHVSLPDWAGLKLIDKLVEVPPHELADPAYWKHNKVTAGHKVHDPQVHSFSDTHLDEPKKVERIQASDVASWAETMRRKKWESSGFSGDVPIAFGLHHRHELAAAAGLLLFRGVPSDVIVLTHPKFRGKGYSIRVARAAAAYAVSNFGLARFRYDAEAHRMESIAAALEFVPYFQQLVIVPKESVGG